MTGKKINAIVCVLLLAGALCANGLPEERKSVQNKEMTAPPEKESGGFAEAQFLYGVYCKEKLKDDKKACKYLELAAKQNHRNAWLYLGKYYYNRKDEHFSYLLWAKLCYMAAERIAPEAQTEFYIGLLEGMSGNLEEFKKWMKLASGKGLDKAREMLGNKEVHSEIMAIKKQLDQQTNPDALKQAVHSHNEKIREITGTTGPEVLDQLSGRPAVSRVGRMICLPQPEGISVPNWNYNSKTVEAFISANLMADREGGMRWITEEFKKQPIWENLAYPNPTIRVINATRDKFLIEGLDKAGFKRCSQKEVKRLIKPFIDSDMPEGFYDQDIVWNLGNDLYFRHHIDTSGRWMLRDYQFFVHKNGETIEIATFPTPPDSADAALIAGVAGADKDCLNNLAVKFADGEMDLIFHRDGDAEEILKALVKRRHAVGTYNLAVFYQNRGKNAEAKKYFALAEKFAGSSVIDPRVHLPEIFDRNGELLVKNRLFRTSKEGFRIHTKGGCFAASLIGDVPPLNKITRDHSGAGCFGIEDIISRKSINRPVYLTIDSNLQSRLEALISDIAVKSDPRYAYGVIVNSKGELLAAAQSSVFDLEKRIYKAANPSEKWSWVFMPAGFLFPVPDQWMKLLGSSSYADPLSKEKFQLHTRLGIFSYEQPGIVPGLNQNKGSRDPKKVSGQSATMLKYMLAYISVAEKRKIPKLVVYTDKVNTPVRREGGIEWISFYRPPDGIVVNALGVIKTDDPKNNLYICIRAVPEERNFRKPLSAELTKIAAGKADRAEEIIRRFTLTAER